MKRIQHPKTSILIILLIMHTFILHAQHNLIPQPVHYVQLQGHFSLNQKTTIKWDQNGETGMEFYHDYLKRATGLTLPQSQKTNNNCIVLTHKTNRTDLGEEGYELEISKQKITIAATTGKGFFYGIQTLLQFLPAEVYASLSDRKQESYRIPAAYIYDYPRFAWRGMMLDVSRQFFDVAFIKDYIDHLAAHKINLFHWHLTDDDGWRIEIKKHPLLTQIGAWRGPNEALPPAYGSGNARYGGYYTQEEIREVVAYAQARHVDILPEIDMPGHSRAVTASYPDVLCLSNDTTTSVQGVRNNVWCAGRNENFTMIEEILSEVADLFPFGYIHIGGDEVNKQAWKDCQRCNTLREEQKINTTDDLQDYFVSRVETIIRGLGKKMVGWNEIMESPHLDQSTAIMAWISAQHGYQAVRTGHQVIMVPGPSLYFDMAQSGDEQGHSWAGIVSLKKVYDFDPAPDDSLSIGEKKLVKGVQAALWSEFLDKPAGIAEYQTFPRLSALAEVAWSPQENRVWLDFMRRLQEAHYSRLYQMGISFRLPPPEAIYENGRISVSNPGPKLVTRYTDDASQPEANSTLYEHPIPTDAFTNYRFRTFYQHHGSISMPANPVPAGKWTPENTPVVYDSLKIDISDFVHSSGPLNVKFRLLSGKHGLLVRKVILLQDGTPIAVDEHEGTIAAGRMMGNLYQFNLTDYNKDASYHILVEAQGRWGTDSYGDILVY